MKAAFLFCVFLIIAEEVSAQSKIEPTIVILYPYQVVATDQIMEELRTYDTEYAITEEERAQFVPASLPQNWRTIRERELDFRLSQSFLSRLVLELQSQLIYRILEAHPNPLIYPVRDKCAGVQKEYKPMALKWGVSWIINITRVELSWDGEAWRMSITTHLYNRVRDRIHVNKTFSVALSTGTRTGDCEDEWICLINEFVPAAIPDLLHELERNRQHWH